MAKFHRGGDIVFQSLLTGIAGREMAGSTRYIVFLSARGMAAEIGILVTVVERDGTGLGREYRMAGHELAVEKGILRIEMVCETIAVVIRQEEIRHH